MPEPPLTRTDAELVGTVPAANAPTMRWPLVKLLRPKQWIKNGFVLAPLIFAGAFAQMDSIWRALLAMALFCVASSAVYVLNDLHDVAKDRTHPVKRLKRPIAAGAVSPSQAQALLGALVGLSLASFALGPAVGAVVASYLALNVAYTFRWKAIPVVDIFCVASGFVLRIAAGAVAISVPLSSWMLITTLCLALYLATIKRQQELKQHGSTGRLVLNTYTPALLERYAQMSGVGAIMFYGLFTTTVRPALAITVPLVLFGLFRYWFLVERGEGESPTDVLWTDVPLMLTVVSWVGACVYALAR